MTLAVIITELHCIVYDGNYALLITDDTWFQRRQLALKPHFVVVRFVSFLAFLYKYSTLNP